MLTYADVFRQSLKYSGIILAGDLVVAFLPFSSWIDSSRIGTVGDLILVEVAVLFMIAGILDISSSAGMAGFRKLFSPNVEFSSAKRREVERKAMVFLICGFLLLVAMIVLAIYDRWTAQL
jgi:hypothetical protein